MPDRTDAAPEADGQHQHRQEVVGPTLPPSAELLASNNKKRKVLPFEDQYLQRLPLADMYEKSFMHKDWVTHVAFAPSTEFFISASVDGVVKFWKKAEMGIEFAKQFKAHLGPIVGLVVSANGSLCASVSQDKTIKVFDVATFDMIGMIKVEFSPGSACWGFKGTSGKEYLAVAEKDGPGIHLYDVRDPATAAASQPLTVHSSPVVAMAFNETYDCIVSTDAKGVIEYWSPSTGELVKDGLAFESKFKTDLYALMKAKTKAKCLSVSPDGSKFAVFSEDEKLRFFRFLDGKLLKVIDESIDSTQAIQLSDADNAAMFKLDPIDFGRRVAAEKEVRKDPEATVSMCFDSSGHFLFYPTLIGIKVLNLTTNRVVKLIGKVENTERFCGLALYEPSNKKLRKIPDAESSSNQATADPTLFCSAFHKQRFYMFTQREPELDETDTQGRDVYNEKPMGTHNAPGAPGLVAPAIELPRGAILHTTMGDIWLRLFPDEVPKTVENFITLAKTGKYDGVIFHRVIKGFMVQTGDPQGDGTGGESCWGGEFEDEFHRSLKHDRPFTLSMANAGPNTNGSQFFITCVPTPWLDNKHSVFGRCVRGGDVVSSIEQVDVDQNDKPKTPIKILSITLKQTMD